MKPRQFNFSREWQTAVKAVREHPTVIEAMERLSDRHYEIAEFKHDESAGFDSAQAKAEFQLDLYTFEVMKWDLWWQRDRMRGGCELAGLALVIAEALFPELEFEWLEGREFSYDVVVDSARTMVFDIHNFDELTAGASLYMASDPKFKADEVDIRAALKFVEERTATLRAALSRARNHIDFFTSREFANVIPLTR